jgi:hypothetical protein
MIVSFVKTRGVGSVESPGLSEVRATEVVADGGTSAASVGDDEIVVVANETAALQYVAWGSVPNAALGTATGASTAGFPVPAGAYGIVIVAPEGSKIAVADALA